MFCKTKGSDCLLFMLCFHALGLHERATDKKTVQHMINPLSGETDFRRQNLTSVDVRF